LNANSDKKVRSWAAVQGRTADIHKSEIVIFNPTSKAKALIIKGLLVETSLSFGAVVICRAYILVATRGKYGTKAGA
jgi:hypothetical protein